MTLRFYDHDSERSTVQPVSHRRDFAGDDVNRPVVFLHHTFDEDEAMDAFCRLATYYETRGDYGQARQYTLRQLELEPWREEAHQQLMRILALNNQRSAALIQYKTCRRILAKELGLVPTSETTALYERIRDGGIKGDERAAIPPDRAGVARPEQWNASS